MMNNDKKSRTSPMVASLTAWSSKSNFGHLSEDRLQPWSWSHCRVISLSLWQLPTSFSIPILGLPLPLFPSILPSRISCSSSPCLIVFLIHLSFHSWMLCVSSHLSCPALCSSSSLLILSCHLIPSSFLHIHLSKQSSFLFSSALNVHVSDAYVAMLRLTQP